MPGVVTGKRQHYIPQFLMRRFAIDPSDKQSLIWRLDRRRGSPRRANTRNEAVQSRYYRIQLENGDIDDSADEILDQIEARAAPVIAKLVQSQVPPSQADLASLALFVVTLKQRTPEGRRQIAETDAQTSKLWLEAQLSDAEKVRSILSKPGRPEEEIEVERIRMLDDLRRGRLELESTPSREVALMFMAVEKGGEALLTKMGWTLGRAPAGNPLVLSDHPVAHHDPTPKFPGAGAGFLSSPGAITAIPIDPRFALILEPREPPGWRVIDLTADDVMELNLLSYAWANEALYGPSQEAVTRVRARAKRHKAQLARLAKQPPRIWVTEVNEDESGAGIRIFRSEGAGQTITKQLYVTPEGAAQARREAFEP
jgi:hypothetical protein